MCFFNFTYERKKKKLEDMKKLHELNKEYYEIQQEIQAYKKLSEQGMFARRTIKYCLGFLSAFSIASLCVYYKTGYDTSSLLSIVATVFGVELLILLFKRVFATDDFKIMNFVKRFKNRKSKNNIEEIPSYNENSIEQDIIEVNKNIENNNYDNDGSVG